jgi:hypothetical protein
MLKNNVQATNNQAFGLGACVGILMTLFSLCACLGYISIMSLFIRFSTSIFDSNKLGGVQIITDADYEANIFPANWLDAPSNIHVTKLKPGEVTRATNVVQLALEKYPPTLLGQTLQRVYVFDTIVQYDASIGGTYLGDQVFLADTGWMVGYTDQFIERAFHEEYSSILLKTYPDYFDEAAWTKINPEQFVYDGDAGFGYIRDGKGSLDYDPKLLNAGFLNQYSSSNMENDFNAFAGRLLVGETEFWQAVDQHDRIQQKALLVIAFYQQLDPMYTEEYFRTLQSVEK